MMGLKRVRSITRFRLEQSRVEHEAGQEDRFIVIDTHRGGEIRAKSGSVPVYAVSGTTEDGSPCLVQVQTPLGTEDARRLAESRFTAENPGAGALLVTAVSEGAGSAAYGAAGQFHLGTPGPDLPVPQHGEGRSPAPAYTVIGLTLDEEGRRQAYSSVVYTRDGPTAAEAIAQAARRKETQVENAEPLIEVAAVVLGEVQIVA